MYSKLFFNHAHQAKNVAQMSRLPLRVHNFYLLLVCAVLVYRFLGLSSCKEHEQPFSFLIHNTRKAVSRISYGIVVGEVIERRLEGWEKGKKKF